MWHFFLGKAWFPYTSIYIPPPLVIPSFGSSPNLIWAGCLQAALNTKKGSSPSVSFLCLMPHIILYLLC